MSVWFTSDLHVGHRFVAGLRGFDDAAEHDSVLSDNWRSRVRKTDHVWVLGDLCASSPAAALELIAGLPGVKHLIAGNHDRVHPMHRDAHNWQRRYLDVFDSVQPFARRKVAGSDVMLSHFPYLTDHTGEARYMQYRLRDEGEWLLHGHVHSPSKGSGREIHVGVDAWGMAPVALDAIEAEMANAR